jgi:hypothetical protein
VLAPHSGHGLPLLLVQEAVGLTPGSASASSTAPVRVAVDVHACARRTEGCSARLRRASPARRPALTPVTQTPVPAMAGCRAGRGRGQQRRRRGRRAGEPRARPRRAAGVLPGAAGRARGERGGRARARASARARAGERPGTWRAAWRQPARRRRAGGLGAGRRGGLRGRLAVARRIPPRQSRQPRAVGAWRGHPVHAATRGAAQPQLHAARAPRLTQAPKLLLQQVCVQAERHAVTAAHLSGCPVPGVLSLLSLCCTCRGTLCGLWPVNRVPARPSRQRLVPGCRRSNRQAGAHRPGDMLPRLAVR